MTQQSKFMKQTLFEHVFKKGFLLTRKLHPDGIWKLPWRRLPSRLPRRRLSPRCDLPPPHPGSRTLTSLATHPSFTLYLAGLRLNGQLGEFIVPDTNLPSCKKYWIVLQRTHLKRFPLSFQIVDSPAPSHQPHWTLSSAGLLDNKSMQCRAVVRILDVMPLVQDALHSSVNFTTVLLHYKVQINAM